MSNQRLIADLEKQVLKTEMNLTHLKGALAAVQNGHSEEPEKEIKVSTELPKKRGPYKMTGKYAKAGKKKKRASKNILKAVAKRTPNLDWEVLIPKTLKESGKALTTAEIVKVISPNVHKNTRTVLIRRCSAVLSNMKRENRIECAKVPGEKAAYMSLKA